MELIHQWKLTTDATDSVGGLVTTNNGGVTFDPVNGASFNGVNQWLSFIKSLTSPFSISVWCKFGAKSAPHTPIGSSTSSGLSITGLYYSPSGGTANAWLNDNVSTKTNEFNNINYPDTRFVLCIMTYNGATLSLYRDNIFIKSNTLSFSVPQITWSIGRMGDYNNFYFKGNMLDVNIYNHSLTQAEITALYNAGSGGGSSSTTPPQAYAGGI